MKIKKTGKKTFHLIFLAMLCSIYAFAANESQVKVSVTPNPVSEDDSVSLKIELSLKGSENVSKPSFDSPGFNLVGQSSSFSAGSTYENGNFTFVRKFQFSYVLFPKASGLQKISNIQVKVGKEIMKGDEVLVNVRAGSGNNASRTQPNQLQDEEEESNPGIAAPSKKIGNLPERFNSDFTVFVSLNKKTAYVGEPIIAEYYLYDMNNLTHMDVEKWPTFNGFWKEDLHVATRFQFEDVYVGNQHMRRALLARFALYGIKPGKISLDKLQIKAEYLDRRRPQDPTDPFSMFFGRGETRTGRHSSQETIIELLPLPEAGRPASFGGAVGKFQLSLTAEKASVPLNSPLNLHLNITGQGNFQSIDEVKLNIPNDFEIYETNSTGSDKTKKVFNYLLLPRKAGKFTIPALQWTYFDIEKKAYVTLSSQSLNIEVLPDANGNTEIQSTNKAIPSISSSTTPQEKNITQAKLEPRFLKPASDLLNQTPEWLRNPFLMAIYVLLGLNTILLAIFLRKKMVGKDFSAIKKITKKKNKLSNKLSEYSGSTDREKFASLEKNISQIFEIALAKNTTGMTRTELEHEWKGQKLPPQAFFELVAALDICEQARYAAEGSKTNSSKLNDVQQKLKKVIKEFT